VDPATGLASPREFFRLVEAELRRAVRYEHPFTVVYVCLDGFAAAEQRGGGAVGNVLLRAVGAVMAGALRDSDTVAWLRGGELGVLMPETGPAAAQTALTRLRAAVDAELRRLQVASTVSAGAVTWIRTEIAVDQLLQRTYQMLYAAQQSSGDRCRHEILDTADVLI
jgi:diguanylate cyclase (GGDEF)-like protein